MNLIETILNHINERIISINYTIINIEENPLADINKCVGARNELRLFASWISAQIEKGNI